MDKEILAYYNNSENKARLDPELYVLDDDEFAFFSHMTGYKDSNDLKQHIINVQAKAYKAYGYPCIQLFGFLHSKMSRNPAYQRALELPRRRKGAILLDIGCCFGNDVRRAAYDGWPVADIVASDISRELWDCGHELFKSTPASFPAAFVAGDAFDPAIISPLRAPPTSARPSDLGALDSLTPLQGHVAAIHVSLFFNLFSEEKQTEVARKIASLLSPEVGSVIFGSHIGLPVAGMLKKLTASALHIYGHSPETWEALWDGGIFEKGTVKVEATLEEKTYAIKGGADASIYTMDWSVTRL